LQCAAAAQLALRLLALRLLALRLLALRLLALRLLALRPFARGHPPAIAACLRGMPAPLGLSFRRA
jgi:hypothetical protein